MSGGGKRVALVDYGIGNLLSVRRAFEHLGAEVVLVSTPAEVAGADRLVLPGVGAFADGMAGLVQRGLDRAIVEHVGRARALLGICLGMQMLFEGSDEFGWHQGLGIIPGAVRAIPPTGSDGRPHKIPHVGWSPLALPAGSRPAPGVVWEGSLLEGLALETSVYFVHSFTAEPTDPGHRVADCHYDGRVIAAAVARGSAHGMQFHPEKSGPPGLRIIARFLET